jgi:putative phosphoribosyl transferase
MADIIEEQTLRNRFHVFKDRFHAGELLTEKLKEYRGKKDAYVLAIPAGGVQVAHIIAERLMLPLDLAVTRKIHVPWNKEAGFGAISWNGDVTLNKPLVAAMRLTEEEVDHCIREEEKIIKRRLRLFRGEKPFPSLKSKIVILVDDGLASGFSMLTTVKAIQKIGVKEIVVAVPTAPESSIKLLKPLVDKIICLNIRSGPVFAVADAYRLWYDLDDEDVLNLLKNSGC